MRLLIIIVLLFSVCIHAEDQKKEMREVPKRLFKIKQYMKDDFSKDKLTQVLRQFLKHSRPNRVVGRKGHEEARTFLLQELQKYTAIDRGESLTVQSFKPDLESAQKMYVADFEQKIKKNFKPEDPEYQKWDTFTKNMLGFLNRKESVQGKNIVWEKKGTTGHDELLILSANYDNFGYDWDSNQALDDDKAKLPGADDNGSGVAMLLEMVRFFHNFSETKKTIRIVFFDFQEIGFLGALHFAHELLKERNANPKLKVLGQINLLMLGYDSKTQDKTQKIGNFKVYYRAPKNPGYDVDHSLANHYLDFGNKFTTAVNCSALANDFSYGDASRFWDFDFGTITFSQDWENDFNSRGNHSSGDFTETLNFSTMSGILTYLTGVTGMLVFDIQK